MTVDVPNDTIGCTTTGNKLVIEKCVFDNNEAFQGESACMSQNSKTSQGLLYTVVCCSNFTNGQCDVTLAHCLLCSGDILLEHFPLVLRMPQCLLIIKFQLSVLISHLLNFYHQLNYSSLITALFMRQPFT